MKELGFGPTEMEASTSWQSSPVVRSTHFNYNQCLYDLYYKNEHNSMLFILIDNLTKINFSWMNLMKWSQWEYQI